MKLEVKEYIKPNKQALYFIGIQGAFVSTDKMVANYANIKLSEFHRIMFRKFKAIKLGDEAAFEDKETAEKALEYIDSLLVIQKLRGE